MFQTSTAEKISHTFYIQ